MNKNQSHKRIFLSCVVSASVCLFTFASCIEITHAQNVPATADLSRFIEPLETIPEMDEPKVSFEAKIDGFQTKPPEGAEYYMFELKELLIDGVTVYDLREINALYEMFIGKTISVAQLYEIASEITRKYREDGYIFARAYVPAQEIDGGAVIIEIVEGSIHEVKMEGLKGKSFSLLNKIGQNIRRASAFNIHMLERQLLLLNRFTGLNAVGVLEPLSERDKTYPGAVALKLVLTEKQPEYALNVDNHGSKFVGPWQVSATALLPHRQLNHGETRLSFYTTPQVKELKSFSISDDTLLTSDGLTMNTNLKYSRSEPGDTLRDLDLNSRYLSLSLGFEYPILLSRIRKMDVFGKFDYNNSKSGILGTRFYDDRLRVLRAGVKLYRGDFLKGALYGDAQISHGLNIFGAREEGSIDLSRAEGRSNFTKVDANVTFLKRIGKRLGLKTSFKGQYAIQPLLSSEEFGYGGYTLGRGYNNSEITGDSGMGASIELSWHQWSQYRGSGLFPGITPFIFYDAGKVWNRDSNTNPESGASAGVGFDFNWGKRTTVNAVLAQPLSRSAQNPSYGNGKNPVFLISVRKKL